MRELIAMPLTSPLAKAAADEMGNELKGKLVLEMYALNPPDEDGPQFDEVINRIANDFLALRLELQVRLDRIYKLEIERDDWQAKALKLERKLRQLQVVNLFDEEEEDDDQE